MAVEFWQKVMRDWESTLYPAIKTGVNIVEIINFYLPAELKNKLSLEYTVGQINGNSIGKYYDSLHVELYISPMLKHDNIPAMEELYRTRPETELFHVSRYSAHLGADYITEDHVKDSVDSAKLSVSSAASADFNDALYSAVYMQPTYSIDSKTRLPLLNLVIIVCDPFEYLLEKKTINLTSDDAEKKITTREVWLPTYNGARNILMQLLIKITGEINLVKHVAYIEYLPKTDPVVKTLDDFYELNEIRNCLKLLVRNYNYAQCEYCEHTTLQCALLFCGACKKVKYCSKMCQKEHWGAHKRNCASPKV